MADHEVLSATFADARRTWEELARMEPQIKDGDSAVTKAALLELGRRVEAHRASIDMLADAIETEPHDVPA